MPTRPHSGLIIDGFTLGDRLHTGGFATIWAVTHPDHSLPMVMKVPKILDGHDGPTIVGFEVEQMIMPRLTGPHVPKVIATGDFDVMPFIVTELIPYLHYRYSISQKQQDHAFAGFSLGGLSAMDIAWHHADYFGKVGAFSASFWWRQRDTKSRFYSDYRDRIMHQQVRRGRF